MFEMNLKEEWREVRGYEGLYCVSNFGKVASLDKVVHCKNGTTRVMRGKIMKPTTNVRLGYQQIRLYDGKGHSEQLYVHRLVADAFLLNPYNKPYINHKDEVRSNNFVDNLEWVTNSENLTYGHAQERRIRSRMQNKIKKLQAELNELKSQIA